MFDWDHTRPPEKILHERDGGCTVSNVSIGHGVVWWWCVCVRVLVVVCVCVWGGGRIESIAWA